VVLLADFDLHALGDGDWFLTDARHSSFSCPLPDVAEHLAADMLLPSLVAGHHTLGCRQDAQPQAVAHPRDVISAGINAQTRLADALEAGDHRLARRSIFQCDLNRIIWLTALHGEIADKAFALQDLCDRQLHL